MMTSPKINAKPHYGADEDSISDWMLLHKRELTWGLVVVAVIGGGLWFYQRSRTIREQHAESAYYQARRSAAAGNIPLAVSDLQNVATRYEGTRAGTQATLFLAQTLYDQRKFKEGVEELKKAEAKISSSDDFAPSVHVLLADGLQELKDFAGAAAQYKLASQATRFPAAKDEYLASAARSYMAAGKAAEAKAIWTELAKDETGPMAAEARIRLGEVNAQAMKI
jgi:hypothetical protein